MKIKTLLKNCTVDYINIVLRYYVREFDEPDLSMEQIDIDVFNRDAFDDFIKTYGNSAVDEWTIGIEDGIPFIVFNLKNLVKEGTKTRVKPTTKRELAEIIERTIEKEGNNCNLNFIDTSNIEDMSYLFANSRFNGNIADWDVSNVKDMYGMFESSEFNGDISKWDVSNVKDMAGMFYCSDFNGDISEWDVSNVTDMGFMFCDSKFNQDISKWNVRNIKDMREMFKNCPLENSINAIDKCFYLMK